MSTEVVEGPTGLLYVITGSPAEGYDVHPVGPPVATYERKFNARKAVRYGEVEAASDTP